MTDNAPKIKAYQELFKIAQDGDFDHYCPGGGAHCLDPIRGSNLERQSALNETLYNLANRKIPNTVWCPLTTESIEQERHIIQLTLAAGANPNYAHYYSFYYYPETVFDAFMRNNKYHGALEVAKTKGFTGPQNQEAFKILEQGLRFYKYWGHPYPGETKIESALYAQECHDQIELVSTLFSKKIYPYDPRICQALLPIVEKKKQNKNSQQNTKTPLQLFNELMGKKGGRI